MDNEGRSLVKQPGAIKKITLEDFVTYEQLTVYPGPKINLVIGPNGSGKSSLICAIVLGLAGKANFLSAKKNVSDYIKYGKNTATIEIDLCQGNDETVVITRNINRDNTSLWSINKKPATEKKVRQLVQSLNIQVDNPCQVMPQGKVKAFSKMNPQELLKNTMFDLCGQESVELFERLIELQKQMTENKNLATTEINELQEEEKKAESLHNTIKEMKKVSKMLKDIEMCKKKILWCEYDKSRYQVDYYENLLNDAISLKVEVNECLKPSNDKLKNIELVNKNLEKIQSSSFATVSQLQKQIDENFELCDLKKSKMQDLQADWDSDIAQYQNRLRDIEQAKLTLSKINSDKENLLNSFGDEIQLKSEMSRLPKPISDLNFKLDELRNSKARYQYEMESRVDPYIRLRQSQLHDLKDANNKRLEGLKKFNSDAYHALLWLRENRNMFSGNVYEPMVMELNFSESQFTKYLENTVSSRDLIAFTFENIEDMNMFIKKTRGELGLKTTNAICSLPSNETFSPPIKIHNLKNLGFFTYIIDTISGPKAILNYLCKQYQIHSIPIGNEMTYNISEKVPPRINFFYSANHRFYIKISSYSGAKITSTSEMKPPKILVNTIDQDSIDRIQHELAQKIEDKKSYQKKLGDINDKIVQVEQSHNSLVAKKHELHKCLEKVKTISSQVRLQEKKIAALHNLPRINMESEKKKFTKQLYECIEKQINAQEAVFSYVKKLNDNCIKNNIIKCKLANIYEKILKIRETQKEIISQLNDVEKKILSAQKNMAIVSEEAKNKLREAKKATGEFLPHDQKFPFSKEFSDLPDDLDDLQNHGALLEATIKRMNKIDKRVFTEYDKCLATIERLRKSIEAATKAREKDSSVVDKLRNDWLIPLEQKIEVVNKTFSSMFAEVGCAGEVKLLKNEENLEKCGVNIAVKFRDEVKKLSNINSMSQSGGEQTISVSFYLLSLQQFSNVPFRCADETNQGMDAVNEDDMLRFLLKQTSREDTVTQYFLIVPKVYNFENFGDVDVHVVVNGPKNLKFHQWDMEKFMEISRRA